MSNKTVKQSHLSATRAQSPPTAEEKHPATWISAAETASLLHLSKTTVLNRAEAGKLPAIIPEDIPLTADGDQNYLIRLEALPHNAQLKYMRCHLPDAQTCALDLTSPRSSFGDVWLSQFLDVSQLIRETERIQREYRHTGDVTEQLSKLAKSNGISRAT